MPEEVLVVLLWPQGNFKDRFCVIKLCYSVSPKVSIIANIYEVLANIDLFSSAIYPLVNCTRYCHEKLENWKWTFGLSLVKPSIQA